MTPEFLADIGEALHGHQWQSALARDINVADRTMRRWAIGENPIPDRLAPELYALIEAKTDRVLDVAERLRRMIDGET